MSDFWLGFFVALGVWQSIQIIFALILLGETTEIDGRTVATYLAFAVVAFVLANLTYMGVIL